MLWLILKMAQFWMVATPSLTHFPHSSLLVTTLISRPGWIRAKKHRPRSNKYVGCNWSLKCGFSGFQSCSFGLVVAVFWWNPIRWSAGKSYEKNLRPTVIVLVMVRFPARHVAPVQKFRCFCRWIEKTSNHPALGVARFFRKHHPLSHGVIDHSKPLNLPVQGQEGIDHS